MPLPFALLLIACGGTSDAGDTARGDTDLPCTPGYGTFEVCVDVDGAYTVWASDGESLGIETRLTGPGCVTMALPPGRWSFWVDGPACASVPSTPLQECDTVRVDVPVDPFACGVG
jgi:hypothetical protein